MGVLVFVLEVVLPCVKTIVPTVVLVAVAVIVLAAVLWIVGPVVLVIVAIPAMVRVYLGAQMAASLLVQVHVPVSVLP